MHTDTPQETHLKALLTLLDDAQRKGDEKTAQEIRQAIAKLLDRK